MTSEARHRPDLKGSTARSRTAADAQSQRKISDQQISWFDKLAQEGLVSKPFNWALFTHADSRFPEIAGLMGALAGSFWALLV
ncbi:MAG: hypothetical protein IE937_10825, partial [Gammaproteobacteria bacterium]|nr:hypothetical protein [Gammaproteobacteria bacterium]